MKSTIAAFCIVISSSIASTLCAQGIQPMTASDANREKNFFNALEKLMSMDNLEAKLAEYEAAKSSNPARAAEIIKDLEAQVNGNEAAKFLVNSRTSADPSAEWERTFSPYIKAKEEALKGKVQPVKYLGSVTALQKSRLLYQLGTELVKRQADGKALRGTNSVEFALFPSEAEISKMKRLFGDKKFKASPESGIGYVLKSFEFDGLVNTRPIEGRKYELIMRDGSTKNFTVPDDLDETVPKPANLMISLRPVPGLDTLMVLNYPLRLKDFEGKSVVVVDERQVFSTRDEIGEITVGMDRKANTKAIYVDSAEKFIEAIDKAQPAKKSSDARGQMLIEEIIPQLHPQICGIAT